MHFNQNVLLLKGLMDNHIRLHGIYFILVYKCIEMLLNNN